MIADSVCLLVLQIKEKPSPQLLSMMKIAQEQRDDQGFSEKVQVLLESHFDQVEANYGGEQGIIAAIHSHKGKVVVDTIGK